jgi:hypothetical protein
MTGIQRILVFQQNGSGESKIKGIAERGQGRFHIERFNIDETLPPFIDDTGRYLPEVIEADIVLDYLKHPDLSHDLAALCRKHNVPVVASGKKIQGRRIFCPPT